MYVNIAEHNAAFSEYLDNDIAVDVVFAVIAVCFVYLGTRQATDLHRFKCPVIDSLPRRAYSGGTPRFSSVIAACVLPCRRSLLLGLT